MTDVEQSTSLWARNGEEMDRAFERLSTEVHRCVQRHGGTVIKARGEGDSHFAVFDRASSGVRAAVDLQRGRLAVGWPLVRAALHTVEADPRDDDYIGAMVNRTARVRATAHGGQIVCTRVVAELVEELADVTIKSLGRHRVRDIPAPVELFQVCSDGLPAEFPPLMTLDARVTAVMSYVVVDQVGSTRRVARAPGGLAEWQGELYRALRAAADALDGQFFKFVGDGCVVAFEDPRSAMSFAHAVCRNSDLDLRAAVTTGLADVVEGELSSAAVWEAFTQVKALTATEVWASPVVDEFIGRQTGSSTAP